MRSTTSKSTKLTLFHHRSSPRLCRSSSIISGPWLFGIWHHGTAEPICRKNARLFDFAERIGRKSFETGILDPPSDHFFLAQDSKTVEPFLSHCHSLVQYSQAHKSVIKLRDQKQLDFEELSAYLSAVVAERDRLAALNTGHSGAPVGISTFLRDKVDQLRGTDDIHTRRERIRKLDIKIKEVSYCTELSPCPCAYSILLLI